MPDGRVLRGEATRRAVLAHAVGVASVEGLDGLSLGRIATDLKLSKSGVFALFGSKEDLQLATVGAASAVFTEHVVDPSLAAPPGLPRVRALCENWLSYSERRIFPGGCFFFHTAAEYDARTGRVHDAVVEVSGRFAGLIEETLREAEKLGHLASGSGVAQLSFELHALGLAANADSVLHGGSRPYRLAAEAMRRRLAEAAA
ncbi:TetR/AcrR family transcriptional regulator [Amycolatopsis minnesotensis]|uniref:TetR/AcrR family transcriptional regulator n=1 Tax=Amycolatopsis minnesotensis TaxID=337894 RepID=A0ABN2SWQ3_9PSEU